MGDLISVVVPAYNAQKYLSRCADSVLMQTYSDLELILVDDGSTDQTGTICDEYAARDNRVVVIHQDNKGVSAARNAGVEKSTGTYLVFVDADDALIPDGLEIMLSELLLANADIAGCSSVRIKEGDPFSAPASGGKRWILEGMDGLKGSLADRGFSYAVWAKMYRRSFIGDIRFAEGKRVHEDAFFLFECFCRQPRIVLCDRLVHVYYVTAGSASRAAFSDKFFDILYFAERKKQMIQEQYPELEEMAYNVLVKANMALLGNLCRTWDRKYRQAERECIRTVRRYREFFVPASKRDRWWFLVLTNHLYYVYKILYGIKCRIRRK